MDIQEAVEKVYKMAEKNKWKGVLDTLKPFVTRPDGPLADYFQPVNQQYYFEWLSDWTQFLADLTGFNYNFLCDFSGIRDRQRYQETEIDFDYQTPWSAEDETLWQQMTELADLYKQDGSYRVYQDKLDAYREAYEYDYHYTDDLATTMLRKLYFDGKLPVDYPIVVNIDW